MTQFLLAAVSHEHIDGTNGRLMSQASALGFKTQVEPFITSNSLILCEGLISDGLVFPDHPYYENLHRDFDLPTSKKTAFIGFDSRGEEWGLSPQDIADRLDYWEATVKQTVVIDWNKKPKTLAEATEWIKNDTSLAHLSRAPTEDEVALAVWISVQNKKFDHLYLQAMRTYAHRFDCCVFVAGAMHALALVLETNYSLVDLVEGEEVANAYHYYLATHRWTELF